MSLTIHQRTTSLIQLIIRLVRLTCYASDSRILPRCVGVIGGVFVCMGYAIRVTVRAVEVVTGNDSSQGIVAAESSGVKVGLRSKWGGSNLRSRSGKLVPQGSGWVMENAPGSAALTGTPISGTYPSSPYLNSPFAGSPSFTNSAVFGPPSAPGTPLPGSAFGPPPMRSTSRVSSSGMSAPGTPNHNTATLPTSPSPKSEKDKAD